MTKSRARKNLTSHEARNLRTLLLLSVFEPENIGARIATARRESGLTQEELADLVGVSTRSFQGYESGAVVPYRHMGKISEITNRPVRWFLHGDQEPPGQEDELRRMLREEVEAALAPLEQILQRLLDQEQQESSEADPAKPQASG